MPELPEVETTRRGIAPWIEGRTVETVTVRQYSLRWPIPDYLGKRLEGQQFLQTGRRGKYLLLETGSGWLLVHLGMSGSLRLVERGSEPGKHDHLDIALDSGKILRFHDPRRFGAVLWLEQAPLSHPLLASLGPEPLSDEFSAGYLYQRARKRSVPIKSFIMDSKVVVGVGNIYANEALFLAGILPTRKAGSISRARVAVLVDRIKAVLARAIQSGGTTLRDFVGGDGKPGYFSQELQVYGRSAQPCRRCQLPLIEIRLGQRSTVYCGKCQT
ncbi:MAG TPA: bifunctional DNA-formamidopyrimidine glycosylase/DNA-(apurinic or apyrimidinic site) lyase [Pseudomonadaceae bacterium]|nr:bifunctional DNA-formamidopyrimidine glycosylase/DNA-(apurinic or apyrimidinic site) lyase [Pseudomonadaceae bacterium]